MSEPTPTPKKVCWNCGSTDFWPNPHGELVCAVCHPNPKHDIEEWSHGH